MPEIDDDTIELEGSVRSDRVLAKDMKKYEELQKEVVLLKDEHKSNIKELN